MELMMILVLVTFCFLVYGLFKSHMKIHKLNRLIKLIWNDKKRLRDFWRKTICKNCMNSVDDYHSYEEYMLYEVCWKCKKNKVAFDTGLYPTCWDCYAHEKVSRNYEHFEQYGYSIIDINI